MPEVCKNPYTFPEAYLPISAVNDGFMVTRNKEHLFSQSASLDLI